MRGTKCANSLRVYPERSFRSLILSEAKRSQRSDRLCWIILVYRSGPQGFVMPLGAELADKTLALLSQSCRDTDYVGWYRQGRIVGVLLTTWQRGSIADGGKTLQACLLDRMRGVFSSTNVHSLQMHGLHLDELKTFSLFDYPPSSPVSENQAL